MTKEILSLDESWQRKVGLISCEVNKSMDPREVIKTEARIELWRDKISSLADLTEQDFERLTPEFRYQLRSVIEISQNLLDDLENLKGGANSGLRADEGMSSIGSFDEEKTPAHLRSREYSNLSDR